MPELNGLKPVAPKRGTPLYAEVRDRVHEAIERGELGPGERLPSTKALSETLDVSLVTVHRALNELVAAGVLRRGQGRGTFVHENYDQPGHVATDVRFGLVFQAESTLADPYHGRVLQGVRDAAAEMGVDLVLLRYGEDWRKECAGFLYVNPFPEQLERQPRYGTKAGGRGGSRRGSVLLNGTPVIGIGASRFAPDGIGVVDADNRSITRRAVELMARHGHARLAYLGDTSDAGNSVDRLDGFREGCEACGIVVDEALILGTRGWRLGEGGIDRLVETLRASDRPTAIVAGGYYFALDVYAAARKAGLEIPRDLSVTGVDDPPSAAYLSPPMTTFTQPLERVGREAVEMLLGMIRDRGGADDGERRGGVSPRLVLETELVSRDSVGPVPRMGGGGR